MKVAEAMITNPLCCTATCTAQIVANLMQQVEYGLIPVLEKFSRHMVGAITDRDLCLRVLAEGRNAAQTSVSECMTAQPICCKPDEDSGDVLRGVITCGLRGVVVVNEAGELEGVVSTASLAKKLSLPFDTEHNRCRSLWLERHRELSGGSSQGTKENCQYEKAYVASRSS